MTPTNQLGACTWGGISIEFGNKRRSVDSIVEVDKQFREQKLPMNAQLLAYGHFHETTVAPADSISKVIAGTVSAVGIDREKVDMLIVASSESGFIDNGKLLPELLHRSGLMNALPLMITAQECAGLLSAIDLACRYTQGGTYRNIVVVSYDRCKSEASRVQQFGIVSDAATACLVSSELSLEFSVRGFSHKSNLRGMRGGDDFVNKKALIDACTDSVLSSSGITLAGIRKVFATNFFKPLARFYASTLRLTEQQIFPDMAKDIGHCLSADPLINLSAFLRDPASAGIGDIYLLQASAPGFLASMLVELAKLPTSRIV